MTWFEVSDESESTVRGTRDEVWAVLTDPDAIVRMTPLLQAIEVDGDHWAWQLGVVKALGQSLAPRFTERMSFDEGERITFTHDPQADRDEVAGVEGTYVLSDGEDPEHTVVAIDFTVRVRLPLPKVAGPGVRTAMRGVLATMGGGFAKGLQRELAG
ncbi:MAG: SRPBCC family protein [Aeromicrobium erythreum]